MVALVLAGVLWPMAIAPTAGAQLPPTEASEVAGLSLTLERLSGVVQPGDELRLRVRVENARARSREDLRVLVTVHRRTTTRFGYQQALDAGDVGQILHGFAADLDPLPGGSSRQVSLGQTTGELGLSRPERQAGVYPLRVRLLAGEEVVTEVITGVVLGPETVTKPVDVAIVAPLSAAPARRPDGVFTGQAFEDALSTDGAIGSTLSALIDHPELAATVVLDGLHLEDVAARTAGYRFADGADVLEREVTSPQARLARDHLAGVREVTARPTIDIVALPFGAADLVALVRHRLRGEALRHLTDGTDAVKHLTGTVPLETVLWPPDGLDVPTLFELPSARIDTVVLTAAYLAPPEQIELSPSPVQELRTTSGGSFTALIPDPWLDDTLVRGTPDGPVVAAQRLVGEMAAVYFEAPSVAGRGLLLAPPSPTTPLPAGLLDALAEQLAGARLLQPVTLSALMTLVEPAADPARLAYPPRSRSAELTPRYLDGLAAARAQLGSLEGVLVSDPATPARFDRLLLRAASIHYRHDPGKGLANIDAVSGSVVRLYGGVEVVETAPITLTSAEEDLPVVVRSTAEVPLRVRISLATPRYALEDAGTREVVLEPGVTEILTFRVRALVPGGTSPVRVVVSDLDGVIDLATGRIIVRSTASSPVAIGLMTGALVVLMVWWLRDGARRRADALQRVRQPTRVA